ncbi:hypothetical protein TNCV_2584931 [Trichonephila clavipes]|nr:hypothetical protein TNCV_2584931 [Trichonephila clavipes]
MPSPVQSNCDAHDTIETAVRCCLGQWDTHNRSASLSTSRNSFREICFLRQQETDSPAGACGAPVRGTIYLSSAGVVLPNTTSVPSTPHSSSFK